MWPRTQTKAVGMDHDDFAKAFFKALQNDSVIPTLTKMLTSGLENQVAELKDLILEKDQMINQLKDDVKQLEVKCDGLEQYSRRNSLRIYGIDEKEGESPAEIVLDLVNKDMDLNIEPAALDRVHRVGKRQEARGSRPLLVKFSTYRDRDRVYRAKARLKERKLGHIYVNEDLTRTPTQLLYQVRQLQR